MSLIVCSKNCRHQKEGYCVLDEITHLTASLGNDCAYFEETTDLNAAFTEISASLGNITHTDKL